MTTPAPSKAEPAPDPDSLAALLDAGPGLGGWTADEHADLLEHLLAAPLEASFGCPAATPPAQRRTTLGQLLTSARPPLDLLRHVKRRAKAAMEDPEAPLPREVLSRVYLATIASALAAHGQKITSHDRGSLQTALRKALDDATLGQPLRELLDRALARLEGPG